MVAVKYMGSYDYQPSIPAAIAFASLFGVTSILHTYQLIRHRTWFFIPFVLGGIFEIIGYAARAFSSHQYPNYTLAPLSIQAVFILVGPSLLAASIYMELGRIMMVTGGESLSLIRRSWLTKIFVLGDIISFLVQAGGASMLVKAKTAENGEKIVKIGLIVQILFFALFIIVSILFHIRLSRTGARFAHTVHWRKHQIALYASSVLVFVRSIFRLVEYQAGSKGPLLQHEYWTYIFDALLILLAMMVFNVAHPGEIGEVLRERRYKDKNKSEHDDEIEFLPQSGPTLAEQASPGYAPPTYVPPMDVDTRYTGAYAQPGQDRNTHYPGGYSRYEGP